MKDKYEETLDFDLFEGDFGSSDDKEIDNKIVKVRKEHECHICSMNTPTGSYARYDVWIFDGEFMKYYVCQDCLDAIIQYENEEYDEDVGLTDEAQLHRQSLQEDELTPVDKRYRLNKHI